MTFIVKSLQRFVMTKNRKADFPRVTYHTLHAVHMTYGIFVAFISRPHHPHRIRMDATALSIIGHGKLDSVVGFT